jgi:uncharacterized glyoxalase superfamily protein PhnB
MPIAEAFFASLFGQLRDGFGTLWTIILKSYDPSRNLLI